MPPIEGTTDTEEKTADEFLPWLTENRPPEDITVAFEYDAAAPHTFHFKRSVVAYDHYLIEIYADRSGGPSPIAVAVMLLTDTVTAAEREDLTTFLATHPGRAIMLSLYRVVNTLLDVFNGVISIEVKNTPSTPQQEGA